MRLLSILKYIVSHPLIRKNKTGGILRFIKWQLTFRFSPYPILYPFTKKSTLVINKGMTGATGNLYCGLHEFADMGFLLHFLRPDDLFVDIGANVGSYTVLASAHVGAKSISFEPVPRTFSYLIRNIAVNGINVQVQVYNMALGAKKGTIAFTSDLDTANHVAIAGDQATIEVSVDTLDAFLAEEERTILIKIDVEGFETEVMNGADNTLLNKSLQAIIIELNGTGERYGYSENAIQRKLEQAGFTCYAYDPFNRELTKSIGPGAHNSIYIRDVDRVKERLAGADFVEILNERF